MNVEDTAASAAKSVQHLAQVSTRIAHEGINGSFVLRVGDSYVNTLASAKLVMWVASVFFRRARATTRLGQERWQLGLPQCSVPLVS